MLGAESIFQEILRRKEKGGVLPPLYTMTISFKKLFKLLIDKGIKEKELARCADISPATLSKMKKDGATITSDVLAKICLALDCTFNDITELVPGESEVPNDL